MEGRPPSVQPRGEVANRCFSGRRGGYLQAAPGATRDRRRNAQHLQYLARSALGPLGWLEAVDATGRRLEAGDDQRKDDPSVLERDGEPADRGPRGDARRERQ